MQKKQTIKKELKKLGANIRRERTAKGITQQELAEMAELNVRTVQKIEAGNINILITTASRLQKGIGCSWEKLTK